MGLEIAELVGLSVAKSEATCLIVILSQPDVLREFPALPVEPESPSTERPDLMTVLPNEIEAKGATLTQAEAEKFARAGVTAATSCNPMPPRSKLSSRESLSPL